MGPALVRRIRGGGATSKCTDLLAAPPVLALASPSASRSREPASTRRRRPDPASPAPPSTRRPSTSSTARSCCWQGASPRGEERRRGPRRECAVEAVHARRSPWSPHHKASGAAVREPGHQHREGVYALSAGGSARSGSPLDPRPTPTPRPETRPEINGPVRLRLDARVRPQSWGQRVSTESGTSSSPRGAHRVGHRTPRSGASTSDSCSPTSPRSSQWTVGR